MGLLVGISLIRGAAASLSLTSQAFTPYRTCTVTATPATTTAAIDATVRQGSASSNFGAITTITVSSGGAVNQRIYLKFDLNLCSPAIPASAIVRLATTRTATFSAKELGTIAQEPQLVVTYVRVS